LVNQAVSDSVQLTARRADVVCELNTLNVEQPTAERLAAALRLCPCGR
jgi:hypothetical protein